MLMPMKQLVDTFLPTYSEQSWIGQPDEDTARSQIGHDYGRAVCCYVELSVRMVNATKKLSLQDKVRFQEAYGPLLHTCELKPAMDAEYMDA